MKEFLLKSYENATLYKDKINKEHEARILQREFHEGEQVLLYNSQFKLFVGKLRSKWLGPFVICKVYSSGAVMLEDNKWKKLKLNGKKVKNYNDKNSVEAKVECLNFKDAIW